MLHIKTNSVNLNLLAEGNNIEKTASETSHRRLLAILYLKKIFNDIYFSPERNINNFSIKSLSAKGAGRPDEDKDHVTDGKKTLSEFRSFRL